MRYISRQLFVFTLVIGLSPLLRADFACSGILTEAQQEGFKALFSPAYSPSLTHTGGAVTPANIGEIFEHSRCEQTLGCKAGRREKRYPVGRARNPLEGLVEC